MVRLRTLCLLSALVLLLAPRPAARADATTDQLRMAATLARDGDWDGAVETLPPVADLDRSHLPLLWQSFSGLREPRPASAAHILAAIRRLDPESSRPRIAMEEFWTAHPALGALYPDDLWLFPVDAEVLGLKAAGKNPAATVATVIPRPFLPLSPATEPRTGKTYNRAVTAYVDRGDRLALRFVVHFTGAVPEARARQVARFMGALSVLSDRMLGGVSRAAYPVHVWLSPEGKPGASQWAGSITIHRADVDRSALEWARELAHEWGHATLPGVEGFVEPEVWANGDLGERLYLPKMSAVGWLHAWGDGLDVAPYTKRYVDPLRRSFARTGPVSRLVRDVSGGGFDHFLGAALYIDAAYGTPALVAALDDLEGQRTANFLAAFQRTLARRATWTVARVDAEGPAPTCFPAAGEYMLDARGVRRNTRPVTDATRLPAGWTMLEWSGSLTVRRATGRAGTAS